MRTIFMLTGAGISTGAGIQDFRGPNGLWTLHPEMQNIFDYRQYMSKPANRTRAWAWTASNLSSHKPSPAHKAIAIAQNNHQITALATQNIDGLHEAAGSPSVMNLHGSMKYSTCQRCGHKTLTQAIINTLNTDPDPHCTEWNHKKNKPCGGVIKPDVIYFGENLNKKLYRQAEDEVLKADEFWAIGTSLTVYPVANLIKDAIDYNKRILIMNSNPTEFDEDADIIVRDDIQIALPRLLADTED